MNKTDLCECTIECPGRQFCEIGTWTRPDRSTASSNALDALQSLGPWLHAGPHTSREISSAILNSIPFGDLPDRVDMLFELSSALTMLGYKSTGDPLVEAIWTRIGCDPHLDNSSADATGKASIGKPLCLRIIESANAPKNFQRVLEFMALLNSPFLQGMSLQTSEIMAMFFPDASSEAVDTWLLQALDDCLFRIGYTPYVNDRESNASVSDNPYWFCDGDPNDSLKHNLWRGEAIPRTISK